MKLIKKIVKKLFFKSTSIPITIYPKNKPIRGRVLFSYLAQSAQLSDNNPIFKGHSNQWESREIINIFNNLGYIVDVIDWNDYTFYPNKHYDVIFDIYVNLQRLAPLLPKETVKLLHLTGSYAPFQNKEEMLRVANLEQRKKMLYNPKRLVPNIELAERSIQLANQCSLIGNHHTISTYPTKYHHKIKLVTVSGSILNSKKAQKDFIPKKKEFLWFFGSGVVHKGLDVILDIFEKNKKLTLNIVGNVKTEKDFVLAYKDLLFNKNNIKYHDFLYPSDPKFTEIVKHCFCFIAPTCSESISTACATCLQFGLYPIISRNTGITLPPQCGIYLERCSFEEIEQAIYFAYNKQKENLRKEIFLCQTNALKNYSREMFTKKMSLFLKNALGTE